MNINTITTNIPVMLPDLSATVSAPPSLGSLSAYIKWVRSLPILNAQEEKDLALRFRQEGDLSIARYLVVTNLRYVVRIAQGYSGYGLPLEDLVQEGNIGLMKAVKRFDPAVGVRLISFAVHWIKAEIHEFVLRNWRMVKVATTKAQRKLFFNLRSITNKIGWLSNQEVARMAQTLQVSPRDVAVMEGRMLNYDVAFSTREGNDGNSGDVGMIVSGGAENYLVAENSDPSVLLAESNWLDDRAEKLTKALHKLDKRSRDILEQRWLKEAKATLHQLADKYKISAERVRQLEERALEKLKKYLY